MNSNNDFDDSLDDCNDDDVVICGITFSASQILKACDPRHNFYLVDYENNKQYEQDEDEGEMK